MGDKLKQRYKQKGIAPEEVLDIAEEAIKELVEQCVQLAKEMKAWTQLFKVSVHNVWTDTAKLSEKILKIKLKHLEKSKTKWLAFILKNRKSIPDPCLHTMKTFSAASAPVWLINILKPLEQLLLFASSLLSKPVDHDIFVSFLSAHDSLLISLAFFSSSFCHPAISTSSSQFDSIFPSDSFETDNNNNNEINDN